MLLIALVLVVLYVPVVQQEWVLQLPHSIRTLIRCRQGWLKARVGLMGRLVYMHHVNWPLGDLSDPMRFGIARQSHRSVSSAAPDPA